MQNFRTLGAPPPGLQNSPPLRMVELRAWLGLERTFIVLIFAAIKKKAFACSLFTLYFASFFAQFQQLFFHAFCTVCNYFSTESPVLLKLIFSCLAVGRIFGRKDLAVFQLYFYFSGKLLINFWRVDLF